MPQTGSGGSVSSKVEFDLAEKMCLLENLTEPENLLPNALPWFLAKDLFFMERVLKTGLLQHGRWLLPDLVVRERENK